jgi:hypothetical protein
MSSYPINVIIQIAGGFLGGNAVGNASKRYDLGVTGNSFVGIVGGTAAGHLVFHVLMPAAAHPDGLTGLGEAAVSALAGAALTAIVRLYRDRASAGPLTFPGAISHGGPTLGRPKLLDGTTLPSIQR